VNHPAEGEEFVTLSALAAFLHLRLNERERAVRLAHNDPRLVAMLREYVDIVEVSFARFAAPPGAWLDFAETLAEHPVIAGINAQRRIVASYEGALNALRRAPFAGDFRSFVKMHLGEMAALTAGDALRALGTQWSGHPSYLPEWAPLSPEVDHTERRGL
jgi:hypothetical protein